MGKEQEAAKAVDEKEYGSNLKARETWSRKFDFLLACTGFSVGLGNVWRFPYLCYKNGGGAFLIPYLICVVVGGIPLFYLEVAVGQFMGIAGLNAWKICPLLQGIGISTTIIVFFLNCYYNVILAWAFYYFFSSFTTGDLPWAKCGHEWNKYCVDFVNVRNIDCNNTEKFGNLTYCSNQTLKLDPTTEFWENKALGISEGIHDMGVVKWDICLCLLFAWIVVYLCICKGIKSSGKVMYVTATSPYIFMTILLIRNSLLDGAGEGVRFYVTPVWEKMANMEVWVDAGTQIFFSYSISIGALTALGSYNKFKDNSYRDAILFACTNSGTSIFAGFIIFTILGNMAYEQGVTVDKVAESGPGLAFIAYPKAVTKLPGAPIWSCIFFLMVILLGLDSQFVGVEGVVTAVVDQWPGYLRKGYRREVFIGCICILNFFVGIPMVMNGGMYVFQLFDYYSGSRIILFVGAFECIAIAWIYGIQRFYDNIQMMLGFKINPYMMICWTVMAPAFCMAIFIMSTINYSELTYGRPSGDYIYPQWAIAIGWSMAAFAAVFIPGMVPFQIWRYGLKPSEYYLLLKPQGLKEHQLRPQDHGEINLDNFRDSSLRYRANNVPIHNLEAQPNLYEKRDAGRENPSFIGERL
ncbi:solute carrier family 6 (neurotransmitter transporter, GABA) member 6/8/11/12/13 [Mytilus galloprovincialis]|uniref:Transporter n=1 Tax=Mytilus galloprovincialis TaxID=29158 RepID=A0A8B6HK91_MYTGA|nr:solute carrier family 6 (neurotransmitter transporter, GABA) member 6/8/11/12/13 [Mytilus galloprovincialis]